MNKVDLALHKLLDALLDQNLIHEDNCDAIWGVVSKFIEAGEFDPCVPNWAQAPYFADYHTIDRDGNGVWWTQSRIQLGSTQWVNVGGLQQKVVPDTTSPYDMDGLDWRNSLRARPEVQP